MTLDVIPVVSRAFSSVTRSQQRFAFHLAHLSKNDQRMDEGCHQTPRKFLVAAALAGGIIGKWLQAR